VKVSVIVPTLNEARLIDGTLAAAADADQLIVVDGGSNDGTPALARGRGALVLHGMRGRGRQLAKGAAAATGDILLFLHADTILPRGFREEVCALVESGCAWGRFNVRFDHGSALVHLIARLISLRSRLTRVATGDQAIFVSRRAFTAVGGLREDTLFEDIDLCRRLKRHGPMGIPAQPVVTSARRWRTDGAWRTSFLMWALKLLYLAGVPADRLASRYRDVR